MDYLTAQQTAERLGVTVRAVQKWAKEGKLSGAKRVGRQWFIPVGSLKIEDAPHNINRIDMGYLLPLLSGEFSAGTGFDFVNSIDDVDKRNIALSEYYYYRNEAESALKIAEPYLSCENPALRISAAMICVFANISQKHRCLADLAVEVINTEISKAFKEDTPPELNAICIFAAQTIEVQFHITTSKTPPIENYLKYLPDGLKLFACYILAYKDYFKKDYSRSLGIVDTAIALCPKNYPLAEAYLQIIAVINLMNLMKTDEAKARMEKVYSLTNRDFLIMILVEHYGLLQGMIEVFYKKNHPQDFEKIIDATKNYNIIWYEIYKQKSNRNVAVNLTTTEFTVAMLYNRNWRIKEIAAYMGLSERTIKNYLQIIYEKLCISGKKELGQYMLQ